jgi:hypothetical protein
MRLASWLVVVHGVIAHSRSVARNNARIAIKHTCCEASSGEVIGQQGIDRTVRVAYCANCGSIHGELDQDSDRDDGDRPLRLAKSDRLDRLN